METREYFEIVMQDYNQNRKGRSLRKYYQDAFLYAEQLLGKTYCFSTTGDDKKIVCAFSLANDSIKAALRWNKNRLRRDCLSTDNLS